jgi:TldD protein
MLDIQEHYSLAEYAIRFASMHGFSYSEAFLEAMHGRYHALEQGKVNGNGYYEKEGIRIRLLKGNKMYTFSTNKLEKKTIRNAILKYKGFRGVDTVFSSEAVERKKYSVKEKKKADNANALKDLLELDKVFSVNKNVKFRNFYTSTSKYRTIYINSEGSMIEADIPAAVSAAIITVGIGKETRQRMIFFGGIGGYEMLNHEAIEDSVKSEISAMANVIKNGVTISNHEMRKIKNVVISPEIAGIAVHESVGHPSEADRVFMREAAQAGTSYITRQNFGMRIGSDAVTIIDDPTLQNSMGFYLYDEEGIKAKKRTIIKNGMQNELLLNRSYAHVLGLKSNASARSESYRAEPIIRMANTYLEPGSASLDELFSEAGNGVYIKSFTEWNIDDTRSFSRYQGNEAYMIKNHRLDRPVKNYVLESKTLDFWNAVKLVGKDFQLFRATCGKGEPMQGVPVSNGGAPALLSFGD